MLISVQHWSQADGGISPTMSALSRRQMIGKLGTMAAVGAVGSTSGLLFSACGQASVPGSTASSEQKPVLIGAAVSSTGNSGKAGEYQAQAYSLWEEQVNQRSGLLGRPVKVLLYDDASEPTAGQKLYEKLISEDKVDLVLGPYANSVTMAASTATEKHHFPMLAAGASVADIWKRNYRYVFGIYASAEMYFHGVVELALKQGFQSIAILNEDTTLPVATAAGTVTYAKSKGMQVVSQDKYPARASDLSALLTKIKAANPDVLVGGSYQADSILITRQAKELGLAPRLLAFSSGAAVPDFGQTLGRDAEYIIGPSIWEPAVKTPGNKEFVDAFQKKWNREPDARAATGFASGQILEAAVKKAASLDREKLRDALATLETTTILPGKYKVDEAGAQVAQVPVLIQWHGTDKPIIWPDQYATARPKLPMTPWNSR